MPCHIFNLALNYVLPIVNVILTGEMINVIWVMITSSTLGKNKAFDSLQFKFNFVEILSLNGEN